MRSQDTFATKCRAGTRERWSCQRSHQCSPKAKEESANCSQHGTNGHIYINNPHIDQLYKGQSLSVWEAQGVRQPGSILGLQHHCSAQDL